MKSTAEWVRENAEGLMPHMHWSEDDLQHITMCCTRLYQWAMHGGDLGHFLSAVKDNDFIEACIRADGVNQRALYLYAMFMLNRMPADKIRGRG